MSIFWCSSRRRGEVLASQIVIEQQILVSRAMGLSWRY